MAGRCFDFRIGSQNVRGINKHSKRMSLFSWIKKKEFDIMLLQETFSSKENKNLWQTEWEGPMYFSHGTKHSCGVAILVKSSFDFEPRQILHDTNGRYIIIKAKIQGEELCIANIYAPNTNQEKYVFFQLFHDKLKNNYMNSHETLIIGGDWNTIISPTLGKSGGRDVVDTVTKEMKALLDDFELFDIWRLKNPNTKRFTFRQKKPIIQSRLDFFMVTRDVIDMTEQAQVLASFCSDHSCISLTLSQIENQSRGPGFWKFNSLLIGDVEFVAALNNYLTDLIQQFDNVDDKRVKWELIKYKVKGFCRQFSILRKRNQNREENILLSKLNELELELGQNPSNNILVEYESCKQNLYELEEEKIRGSIIRSKSKWIEKGEKSNKYFFDLEKTNYRKKHIRKLNLGDGKYITNNKEILNETANFYKNLYNSNSSKSFIDRNLFFTNNAPKISEQDKEYCDNKITVNECFQVLQTFKNNKSPGNDGLTKEFYQKFWNYLSKPLLECFEYSFQHGCLSSSPRQAIITLIEKKGNDRTYLSNWR